VENKNFDKGIEVYCAIEDLAISKMGTMDLGDR